MAELTDAEGQHDHAEADDVIKPVIFEIDPVEQPDRDFRDGEAAEDADGHFEQEFGQDRPVALPRSLDHSDHEDGQERRHRIIAAGFEFEHGLEFSGQPHPAVAEHREHCRVIGGGNDRAEQQTPFERRFPCESEHAGKAAEADAEQHKRENPDEQCSQQHAEAGEGASVSDHVFD
ncbi:hypothetical protein SDC9_194892 [bioreactor metagenome]|uniref:Uncharacterized protein n=1 Tax=bioreactor metagenome TaxID=1076179 RepID=A0A645I830_9ZZZZ